MRYAVISDVHANIEALDRVLADARSCGALRVVCLGDVVGYGPCPSETLARIRASCCSVVAGNHDDAVCGRRDASAFIELAGEAASRHRDALSQEDRRYLASLPYESRFDGALAVHGDASDPSAFNYVEDEESAAVCFAAAREQIVFVGHTHVPAMFLTGASGRVYRVEPQDFVLEDGKRYIVNPGSVGYPRENGGRCMSSYVIYDTDERSVRFRRLPFSVASVMQRGTSRKRLRRRLAGAAAAALLALGAAAALLLSPRPADPAAQDVMFIDRRTLSRLGDRTAVCANLKLARGSAPVLLEVRWADGAGAALGEESSTVKKASTRQLRVPKGAASVVLTVSRVKAGDEPRIVSFQPSASYISP